MTTDKTRQISALNDLARRCGGSFGTFSRLVQTPGLCALPPDTQSRIRERVETFSDFTPNNDPHEERDFGAFTQDGHRIFWKIDYYDPTLTQGSEDPSNALITTRVLTIMLAGEW